MDLIVLFGTTQSFDCVVSNT